MDWQDLLAVQGTLKGLIQHHSSKASIFQCSAFFILQISHPYMTTGKTIALTRLGFVGKILSLLFNMLSSVLPKSNPLLISWLQSPFAVKILEHIYMLQMCVCVCMYIYIYTFISEKAMAPHSSTLAQKIRWIEEHGRLQSMGSQRVRHD